MKTLLLAACLLAAPAFADYYVCWSKPYDTSYTGPWLYGWGQTEEAAREEATGLCRRKAKGECHATCRRQKSKA